MSETENIEEVVKPKRAPAKRAAKKTVSKTTPKPRKTAARKTPVQRAAVPTKTTETPDVSEAAESTSRKAPTAFASEKQRQKQRQKHSIVIGLILIVGVGASAAVGYTDKGQINVTQVIEDRNQRVRTGATDDRDVATDRIEVPVQNTNKQANGGLVGLGTGGAKPKPPVDTSTTTASSTDATASSTEATASSSAQSNESASSTDQENIEQPNQEGEIESTSSSTPTS